MNPSGTSVNLKFLNLRLSGTEVAVDIGLAVATGVGILVCCISGITTVACVIHRNRGRPRDDSTDSLV